MSTTSPSKEPQWQRFRRAGTVLADRREASWRWRTPGSGETMQASAGDWEVRESDTGESWSVRDDIFRSSYEHVAGRRWRRLGTVEARPARDGETIDTLEGPVTATAGEWVVRGEVGEVWPVPAEEFVKRYDGPVSEV